jgi:uncharacterized protein YlxW (UPF0749 family)
MALEIEGLKEFGAGVVVALVGGVVALRKLQVSWKNDGGNITAIETMQSLVTSLREEITRLQTENVQLRNELRQLKLTVDRLSNIANRSALTFSEQESDG